MVGLCINVVCPLMHYAALNGLSCIEIMNSMCIIMVYLQPFNVLKYDATVYLLCSFVCLLVGEW